MQPMAQMHDFKLITSSVINDFGAGIPVCWAISNREDSLVLVEMLKPVRERCGALSPHWFMSGNAQQYFSGWRALFGTDHTKQLLCSWHVDRAWRNALARYITDQQQRIEIHHHLQLLLTQNEE